MLLDELINKDITYSPAGKFEETRFEKIHNVIFNDSNLASILVAQEIAALIKQRELEKKPCILEIGRASCRERV